jgi:hypothetical protein
MNNLFSIRVTSFALAMTVTLSVLAGLDTLARDQHAGRLLSQQACAPDQVAAARATAAQAALGS